MTSSIALWLNEFLRQQLSTLIYYQTDGLYTVKFSDIDVNPFTLTASVDDLSIVSHPKKGRHTQHKLFLNGDIRRLSLSGIDLFEMFAKEALRISRLSIVEPTILLYSNPEFVPEKKSSQKKISISFYRADIIDGSFCYKNKTGDELKLRIEELTYYESIKEALIINPRVSFKSSDKTNVKARLKSIELKGATLSELMSDESFSHLSFETNGLQAYFLISKDTSKTNNITISNSNLFDSIISSTNGAIISIKDNEIYLVGDHSSAYLTGAEFSMRDSTIVLGKWRVENYTDSFNRFKNSIQFQNVQGDYAKHVRNPETDTSIFSKIEIDEPVFVSVNDSSVMPIRNSEDTFVIRAPDFRFLFDTVLIKNGHFRISSRKNNLVANGIQLLITDSEKSSDDLLLPVDQSILFYVQSTRYSKKNKPVLTIKNLFIDNEDKLIRMDTLLYSDVNIYEGEKKNAIQLKLFSLRLKFKAQVTSDKSLIEIDSIKGVGGDLRYEKKVPHKNWEKTIDQMHPFLVHHINLSNINYTFVRNMRVEKEKNSNYLMSSFSIQGKWLSNRSENSKIKNNTLHFSFVIRGAKVKGDLNFNLAEPHFHHHLHAHVGYVNLRNFNKELASVAGLAVEEGKINSMEIDINGTLAKIKSSIKIRYSDLNLNVVKNKDQFKTLSQGEELEYIGFLSRILNKTIKNSNTDEVKINPVTLEVTTDPEKNVINTWVRTVLLSTVQTIVPATEKILDFKRRRDEKKKKRKEKRKKDRNILPR